LSAVINEFEIGEIIAPEIPPDMVPATRTYENFLMAVSDSGLKMTKAAAGDTYMLEDAQVKILAPSKGDYYEDLNDYSTVCSVTAGDKTYLFTGDASAAVMTGIRNLPKTDVFKAGHHGSRYSVSEDLFKAIQKKDAAAVISCGADNRYGHPHKESLELMAGYYTDIFRTDRDGDVVIGE
jgi:competence protein ComEC